MSTSKHLPDGHQLKLFPSPFVSSVRLFFSCFTVFVIWIVGGAVLGGPIEQSGKFPWSDSPESFFRNIKFGLYTIAITFGLEVLIGAFFFFPNAKKKILSNVLPAVFDLSALGTFVYYCENDYSSLSQYLGISGTSYSFYLGIALVILVTHLIDLTYVYRRRNGIKKLPLLAHLPFVMTLTFMMIKESRQSN